MNETQNLVGVFGLDIYWDNPYLLFKLLACLRPQLGPQTLAVSPGHVLTVHLGSCSVSSFLILILSRFALLPCTAG